MMVKTKFWYLALLINMSAHAAQVKTDIARMTLSNYGPWPSTAQSPGTQVTYRAGSKIKIRYTNMSPDVKIQWKAKLNHSLYVVGVPDFTMMTCTDLILTDTVLETECTVPASAAIGTVQKLYHYGQSYSNVELSPQKTYAIWQNFSKESVHGMPVEYDIDITAEAWVDGAPMATTIEYRKMKLYAEYDNSVKVHAPATVAMSFDASGNGYATWETVIDAGFSERTARVSATVIPKTAVTGHATTEDCLTSASGRCYFDTNIIAATTTPGEHTIECLLTVDVR